MSYREQEAHGPHRLLEQQFMYLSISKILDITYAIIIIKLPSYFQDFTIN